MTTITLPHPRPHPLAPSAEVQPLSPIFIVGVSRSGTTLLRRILNRSDQIAICSENHFLGHLLSREGTRYKFRHLGPLTDDANVHRLVTFIYSGGLEKSSRFRQMSSHWYWLIKRVPPDTLRQRILASDRSEKALFTIIMSLYAEQKGKPLMGEKTPAHIRYVNTLMHWYPHAKIVHMLRDPRAIYVSEVRRRQKEAGSILYRLLKKARPLLNLFVFVQTALAWWDSVSRYCRYQRRFADNYYLLPFEHLVQHPEPTIGDLCDFLGVEFQAGMLQQEVVSQGFTAGQAGFDAHSAHRWQAHIEPWANTAYTFLFKKHLITFGYLSGEKSQVRSQ